MKKLCCLSWVVLSLLGLDQTHAQFITVEPDSYPERTVLNHIVPEVSLITAADNNLPHRPVGFDVTAAQDLFYYSTADYVFAHVGVPFFYTDRRLRMDFNGLVSSVSIDFVGGDMLTAALGQLQVYGSDGALLDTYTTGPRLGQQVETMSIDRPSPDIAWAVAYSLPEGSPFGRLDHLVFAAPVPVPEPAPALLVVFGVGTLLILGRRTGAT